MWTNVTNVDNISLAWRGPVCDRFLNSQVQQVRFSFYDGSIEIFTLKKPTVINVIRFAHLSK